MPCCAEHITVVECNTCSNSSNEDEWGARSSCRSMARQATGEDLQASRPGAYGRQARACMPGRQEGALRCEEQGYVGHATGSCDLAGGKDRAGTTASSKHQAVAQQRAGHSAKGVCVLYVCLQPGFRLRNVQHRLWICVLQSQPGFRIPQSSSHIQALAMCCCSSGVSQRMSAAAGAPSCCWLTAVILLRTGLHLVLLPLLLLSPLPLLLPGGKR